MFFNYFTNIKEESPSVSSNPFEIRTYWTAGSCAQLYFPRYNYCRFQPQNYTRVFRSPLFVISMVHTHITIFYKEDISFSCQIPLIQYVSRWFTILPSITVVLGRIVFQIYVLTLSTISVIRMPNRRIHLLFVNIITVKTSVCFHIAVYEFLTNSLGILNPSGINFPSLYFYQTS
jgi:hypothetical protein